MKELTIPISVEQVGRTMIVTPVDNLGELEYEEFEPEARAVCRQFERSAARCLIVDLQNAQLLGSSTVGWLLELRRIALSRHARMALCGLSPTAREVLEITRLADRWPIYESRDAVIDEDPVIA